MCEFVAVVWSTSGIVHLQWSGYLIPESQCWNFISADVVTAISLVILVGLFSVQRFGTARVSFLFAPIFTLWFVSIALVGCYNIVKWDHTIFQAFSPLQIIYFFKRNGRLGWEHLGGVVLCITGTFYLTVL